MMKRKYIQYKKNCHLDRRKKCILFSSHDTVRIPLPRKQTDGSL